MFLLNFFWRRQFSAKVLSEESSCELFSRNATRSSQNIKIKCWAGYNFKIRFLVNYHLSLLPKKRVTDEKIIHSRGINIAGERRRAASCKQRVVRCRVYCSFALFTVAFGLLFQRQKCRWTGMSKKRNQSFLSRWVHLKFELQIEL